MSEDYRIVELTDNECWEILDRERFGRLAVAVHGDPDIFPVNFLVDDGKLLMRTAPGTKLTELVINAVKHAFPTPRADAAVGVRYQVSGEDWRLTVSDNGIGKSTEASKLGGGLGTAILGTLVYGLTYVGVLLSLSVLGTFPFVSNLVLEVTQTGLPFVETMQYVVLPSIAYNTVLMLVLTPLMNMVPEAHDVGA